VERGALPHADGRFKDSRRLRTVAAVTVILPEPLVDPFCAATPLPRPRRSNSHLWPPRWQPHRLRSASSAGAGTNGKSRPRDPSFRQGRAGQAQPEGQRRPSGRTKIGEGCCATELASNGSAYELTLASLIPYKFSYSYIWDARVASIIHTDFYSTLR
jgi:hypothetical protein